MVAAGGGVGLETDADDVFPGSEADKAPFFAAATYDYSQKLQSLREGGGMKSHGRGGIEGPRQS